MNQLIKTSLLKIIKIQKTINIRSQCWKSIAQKTYRNNENFKDVSTFILNYLQHKFNK